MEELYDGIAIEAITTAGDELRVITNENDTKHCSG